MGISQFLVADRKVGVNHDDGAEFDARGEQSMENNKVHPFSNGTEFMIWRSQNCDVCLKDCPYDEETESFGESVCEIEKAISLAAIGDGMIDRGLADSACLPFFGRVSTCSELIQKS